MDTALVTGGAGFLGSHVAERLVAAGLRVVVLDDLSGGFKRNVPAGAKLSRGSVTDADRIESLFRQHRFRYVFHVAAHAAEALSHFIRHHNYSVNLLGSALLVNAAVRHEVECFVFTSSIAVYGGGGVPFREESVPRPTDPYGISKLAAELDLRAARDLFGLRSIVFRPHNVYGERQNLSDPYRNVIGIFMNQVMRGQPCAIFGDGTQTRAFTHVDDVAPLIANSVRVPAAFGETFNIGADEACTVNDLAVAVQRAMGRDTGIRYLPPRAEEAHLLGDHSRVRDVFGRTARIGLDEGLDRTARWAGTITPAPPRVFAAIEIDRGLPRSWADLSRESPD